VSGEVLAELTNDLVEPVVGPDTKRRSGAHIPAVLEVRTDDGIGSRTNVISPRQLDTTVCTGLTVSLVLLMASSCWFLRKTSSVQET
jgi:hypothetical protein